MEAAVANLFSAGDAVAVCCNGKFGEMWAGLAEAYGLAVSRICRDWSQSVDPAEVEAWLARHPETRAVLLTWCDTANGVKNDVAVVARVAAKHGALVLVDGVSSIGGMPFQFDEWGIDFAATASQKCLMSSPGIAFVSLSERAWSATRSARLPRSYWDFADIRKHVTRPKPETPSTTPVHLVLQVAEALRMIEEEGLDQVFRRHDEMAVLARSGVAALGLTLQCPALDAFSSTVTAIAVPEAITPKALRDGLKQRGILTASGLGQFEARGFRIGHLGDIRPADVQRTLDALKEVLNELREKEPSIPKEESGKRVVPLSRRERGQG